MIEDKKIQLVYVGQLATLVCSISKDIPAQVCYFFRKIFVVYLILIRMYFG